MIFQGKDGELRIYDFGNNGVTYYMKVLFCEMNYDGPLARLRGEERLIMDRGMWDSNAHYVTGNDEPRYAPMPITFSCRVADSVNFRALSDWVSGVTNLPNNVGGTSKVYSWSGKTTIDGVATPVFADTPKATYRVEVLWDGTNDFGFRNEEVYFPPGEQKITESADALTITINGQIMGDVTRITAFHTGCLSFV